jgi:dsRNA-specific ribonuclease
MRSTSYLSKIAKENNFDKYVKYDKSQNIHLDSLYEDVFESFFGAIVILSEKFGKGYGYNLIYGIASKMFDKTSISLNIDDLFDAKSRVKEIYDSLKWNFNDKSIRKEKYENGKYYVSIEAYPKGDRTVNPLNKKIYEAFSNSYERAYNDFLYKNMLRDFNNYGIIEKTANPYGGIENSTTITNIVFTQDFRDKIVKMLYLSNINEKHIEKFSRDIYLAEFTKCFIDSSYDSETNMELYLYEGAPVIDYIVIDYITSKIKSKKEGLFTTVRHNIIGRSGLIKKIFYDFDLESYILYGPFLRELFNKIPDKTQHSQYQKLIENCVKALIGCMVHLFDKNIIRGTGYAIAYNFLSHYLDTLDVNDYIQIDYKTKLKEIYDKDISLGRLNNNIVHFQDEETRLHHIRIMYRGREIAHASDKLKATAENKASKIAYEKIVK